MREKSETNTFLFIRMFFSSFSFSSYQVPLHFVSGGDLVEVLDNCFTGRKDTNISTYCFTYFT